MHLNDQTNSVPDEQFGDQHLNSENTGKAKRNVNKTNKYLKDSVDKSKLTTEDPEILPVGEDDNVSNGGENIIFSKNKEERTDKTLKTEVPPDEEASTGEVFEQQPAAVENQEIENSSGENVETDENKPVKKTTNKNKGKASQNPEAEADTKSDPASDSDNKEDDVFADVKETENPHKSSSGAASSDLESIRANYALLSKTDLLSVLEDLISKHPAIEIRQDVDDIKTHFYKKHKSELEKKKKLYISEGGIPEDFKPMDDPEEIRLKELVKKYRDLRIETARSIEEEKQENLKKKYQVIEEIKELINSQESINKTFQDFRELQTRWREIGVVPQGSLNDLWENYHHYVEKFYDYIKINKELRDLDLKKNMEEKLLLCEKAEALLLEPNIVNAFNTLQVYHEAWREIGPVPVEKRSEIWERFKEATAKINKKHQQYFQDIKEQQRKNLEQKILFCERVENCWRNRMNHIKTGLKPPGKYLKYKNYGKPLDLHPKRIITVSIPASGRLVTVFLKRKGSFMPGILRNKMITCKRNWNFVFRWKLLLKAQTGKPLQMK